MSPLSIYELIATLPLLLSFAHAVPIAQESSPASSSDISTTGFSFPLTNGFPNVTILSTTLTAIEDQAHGTLPNSPLPTKISPISATVWQIIAFNEIFEVAFFTSLIQNITTNVTGFETSSPSAIPSSPIFMPSKRKTSYTRSARMPC
ncbi:hypothetical protein M409DRAFT_60881 [Zasmidium cellare ATCC 36951]|uniref:Uncharacterized protein n=1 Tax=Zasmidium cellare ATCC 36951 TaxID=1080233 RepID=A0A6A6BX82_ZASCE|nr:uncharacterized protein M409DRAFT_60881 [Zasmidium cellare ATCC 36951]KAF2159421.1 hypothetical protein M409DRAFT_60881 [Zasmidium cellare ATCC 36951]